MLQDKLIFMWCFVEFLMGKGLIYDFPRYRKKLKIENDGTVLFFIEDNENQAKRRSRNVIGTISRE